MAKKSEARKFRIADSFYVSENVLFYSRQNSYHFLLKYESHMIYLHIYYNNYHTIIAYKLINRQRVKEILIIVFKQIYS